MDPEQVDQMVTRIFVLLGERLDARGPSLRKRLAYVNRRLSKSSLRAGSVLVEAHTMSQSPKLARIIDGGHVKRAYDVLYHDLSAIDPAAERSRRRYNLMATIAAQVLMVLGAFAVLLWGVGQLS